MRFSLPQIPRLLGQVALGAALALLAAASSSAASRHVAEPAWPGGVAVVGYRSPAALRAALAGFPGRVVRRLPALNAVEFRPDGDPRALAEALADHAGIEYVSRVVRRYPALDPALAPAFVPGGSYEWQFAATRETEVPTTVQAAASTLTIGVVDSGADVDAPDLAVKNPATHSVTTGGTDAPDTVGHGTFVASLAAGSTTNDEGVSGFGGAAKLLVVQVAQADGTVTDVDEAAGIVYAVDHGARIINLSLGGPQTSPVEQNAIDYAADHGALLVVAAGNSALNGDAVSYPAALVQPVGSSGQGGRGLAVGASTLLGTRASFSNTGSYISLAAPGENVFGALSSDSSPLSWPRVGLPGSVAGLYGYSSGTSFAAPEVAGAAALVWAANPLLQAGQVASILKATASGHGLWNQELGYGVIDVASAVARAQALGASAAQVDLTGELSGSKVKLRWSAVGASTFRLSVSKDGASARVLLASTTDRAAGYDLDPGHAYRFTVAAVDPFGFTAVSDPFTVTLPRASSALALRVSKAAGVQPLAVRVAAVLRSGQPTIPASGRGVVLESFDGSSWKRFARAQTRSGGNATWALSLRRGTYRLRVRFVGAIDLAPAVSATVAVRVRGH